MHAVWLIPNRRNIDNHYRISLSKRMIPFQKWKYLPTIDNNKLVDCSNNLLLKMELKPRKNTKFANEMGQFMRPTFRQYIVQNVYLLS